MRYSSRRLKIVEETLKPSTIRLDVFLKQSRLVARRTLTQDLCLHGGVFVNGRVAKTAKLVKSGDVLEIRSGGRSLVIRVLKIPKTTCTKQEAAASYEQVESPYVQRFPEQ